MERDAQDVADVRERVPSSMQELYLQVGALKGLVLAQQTRQNCWLEADLGYLSAK